MKIQKIFSTRYLREQFDFMLAGKWLIYGSIIGIVSGSAAALFQLMLSFVSQLSIGSWMGLTPLSPGGETELFHLSTGSFVPYLVVIIPTLGGLLAGWIVYTFAPEAEGHGTDEVIKAYHKKRGIIQSKVPFVKLIASVVTIGTGGSGGREGPIAQIGAGFGSFLGRKLGLNTKTRRWLLASGMGAGIGSIFHAPLAGAIFAAEVLYSDPEIEAEVLLPSTVSSIIAYTVYSMVFGWHHMFIESSSVGFNSPLELLPYLILAIILAFASHIFIRVFYGINNLFKRLHINNIFKPAIGGFLTGSLALAMILILDDTTYVVDLMGGGYGILQEIFDNGIQNIGIVLLMTIGLLKILTTSFSIGSGGSAGVFGPSMVIGGTIGTSVGFMFQKIMPGIVLNPVSFTIVGMAGFFAAAANTPLSTIIMVSELTGNYQLLLPSMWVCTIAYFISRKWTIYRGQVANKNHSQAHFGRYSPQIITGTSVGECYKKSRKFSLVEDNASINEILELIDHSRQRVFPVVDENGSLIGGFNIDDVTHVLHDPNTEIKTAKDLMYTQIPVVHLEDNLEKANKLMNDSFMDEALILDDSPEKRVIGIITSSDVVLMYNRKLSEMNYGDQADKESAPSDFSVLKALDLNRLVEKDLVTLHPDDTLRKVVDAIIKSKRNIFPVVDDNQELHGMLLLNDIRQIMFDQTKYEETKARDLMTQPPDFVCHDDTMQQVITKFEASGAWNLPVIDEDKHYVGLVSKSSIFSQYRKELIRHTIY
jgi:chloride channel protein, CIC family